MHFMRYRIPNPTRKVKEENYRLIFSVNTVFKNNMQILANWTKQSMNHDEGGICINLTSY